MVDADQSVTRRAMINNHLGLPEGVTGPELVEAGKKQATRAGAEWVTAKVTEAQRQGEGFALRSEDGQSWEAGRRIPIICAPGRWHASHGAFPSR